MNTAAELAKKLRAAADSLHSSIPAPHMERTMREAADAFDLLTTPVEHRADERFEFKSETMAAQLRELGTLLAAGMPTGWGFSLYLFQYGSGGGLFYISSARREDVVRVMKEWLEKEGHGKGRPVS